MSLNKSYDNVPSLNLFIRDIPRFQVLNDVFMLVCRAVFTYEGKTNDLKVAETGGKKYLVKYKELSFLFVGTYHVFIHI